MKIIVTGGTGFIGTALLPRLCVENHAVVALTRDPTRAGGLLPPGVTAVAWSGITGGDWRSHLEGADAVINLAGEALAAKRWTPEQKERIINSRVDALHAIGDALVSAPKMPSVVISSSAVGYYGPVEEGEVTEEREPGTDFLARTCVRWEAAANAIGELGPRIVVLRSGVVLGDGGGALERMLLPFRLFAGGPIGSGRQWFPWVHRDDLVNIILFALRNPEVSGPLNAVAPESVSMKTFSSALGKAIRRPSWAPVPAPILRLALGEMADMLLTGQRVVPGKLQKLGFTFTFPTLPLALTDIVR